MSGKKPAVEPALNSLDQLWSQSVGDFVNDLSWSPDGRFLAVADAGGGVSMLDGGSGCVVKNWLLHPLGALKAKFSFDGGSLASSGQDGQAVVVQVSTLEKFAACDHGKSWVEQLSWHSKELVFLTAAGKEIRLWSYNGQLLQVFDRQASTVADLSWNPAAPDLFASSGYGGVHLWSRQNTKARRFLDWKGSILNLSYSPSGKVIAAGCQDGAAHIWLLPSGDDLFMNGYPTKVRELAWDSSSRYLATGGGSQPVVWDFSGKGPSGSKPLMLQEHDGFISALAFAPGTMRLASGGLDGVVYVHDLADRRAALLSGRCASDVSCLAWHPGARKLAVGCASGELLVFAD
ncbi:MAG: WD40 repeat domain-containing protein [Candidatus Melainabacteria bacterium]|nr:WD40 repeat domain-containing protein [Candidatus Melainabacteria bacterium]